MTFITVPCKGVPTELRAEIEAALPTPLKVPGWKFKGYVWRKLTQINTKDKRGFTDNSVRLSGTGDNETLEQSLRKGIDTTKLTPSLYPNDNLLNGFNRLKQLIETGYKEWIFAVYEEDKETATEFQSSHEEFVDDFRAAANKRDGTSWKRRDETFDNKIWNIGGLATSEIPMTSASKPLDSIHLHLDTGSRKAGGGVWYDEGGIADSDWTIPSIAGVSSQSFSYQSPDIEMNVTDIVNKWLDGTRQNEGFIIKWDSNDSNMNSTSQSQEDSSTETGDINFFSSNANSIYSPKIEVRWDNVGVSELGRFTLQDPFGGGLININMTQQDGFMVDNPSFTLLNIGLI